MLTVGMDDMVSKGPDVPKRISTYAIGAQMDGWNV